MAQVCVPYAPTMRYMVSTYGCTRSRTPMVVMVMVASFLLVTIPMTALVGFGGQIVYTDKLKDNQKDLDSTTMNARTHSARCYQHDADHKRPCAPEHVSVTAAIVVSEMSDKRPTHPSRRARACSQEPIMAKSIDQIVIDQIDTIDATANDEVRVAECISELFHFPDNPLPFNNTYPDNPLAFARSPSPHIAHASMTAV